MTEGMQRRLAAIVAADVVGYSRLMGADEEGTLAALRALRKDLFEPAVVSHRGAVVKRMGDGWLVEFASVADAVSCALAVQEKLAGRDTVELRIGVHLGDITHEDEDIYGDGVNIAARLQEIAEPGAIIISDIAWRSIDGKLSAAFADLGEQDLKNIAKPVTAYGWGMTAIANEPIALTLPDKPSIAVLPFENMSGDPDQEYFADGIAEDIITGLSRNRGFFRHRPQLELHLPGRSGRCEAGGAGAGCPLRTRGQRPQSGRSSAHHGTARRRHHGQPRLGRALRP